MCGKMAESVLCGIEAPEAKVDSVTINDPFLRWSSEVEQRVSSKDGVGMTSARPLAWYFDIWRLEVDIIFTKGTCIIIGCKVLSEYSSLAAHYY